MIELIILKGIFMKSVMVDLLEGFIWLAVVVLVVGGGVAGFSYGMGGYRPNVGLSAVFAGVGMLSGLCVAGVVCGPMFILLQIRDSLKSLDAKAKVEG